MKYDLDYQGATEILESRLRTGIQPKPETCLKIHIFRSSIRISLKRLNALTRCFR